MKLSLITFTAETPHLGTKRHVTMACSTPGKVSVGVEGFDGETHSIDGFNERTMHIAKAIACQAFGEWTHDATLKTTGDKEAARRPNCEYTIVKQIAELLVQLA